MDETVRIELKYDLTDLSEDNDISAVDGTGNTTAHEPTWELHTIQFFRLFFCQFFFFTTDSSAPAIVLSPGIQLTKPNLLPACSLVPVNFTARLYHSWTRSKLSAVQRAGASS